MKINPSQNGEITLRLSLFDDVGKSCPGREFLIWANTSFNAFHKNKILTKISTTYLNTEESLKSP